ncbi:Hypothetical protein SaO326_01575 [Staphylococcus aureus]|nr:Hypothetical protein SaO326_01575 [Staphylococcus aureus]
MSLATLIARFAFLNELKLATGQKNKESLMIDYVVFLTH